MIFILVGNYYGLALIVVGVILRRYRFQCLLLLFLSSSSLLLIWKHHTETFPTTCTGHSCRMMTNVVVVVVVAVIGQSVSISVLVVTAVNTQETCFSGQCFIATTKRTTTATTTTTTNII